MAVLNGRLSEPRRLLQVPVGARQVGKTTIVLQTLERLGVPHRYASADEPTLRDSAWLRAEWEAARSRADEAGGVNAVMVVDEIQKVTGWSETVKRLWDEDSRSGHDLRVVLLGSAPLLVERRPTESLSGRFETIHVRHWSFPDMRAAFGWPVERSVLFGGYPGAAPLVAEPTRWARYVGDSLIEPTIARDVLLHTRVDKPALLRRLFELGCAYSGQVLSYTKMLGQLQDAGNATTLAHYLDLLAGAGMLTGLQEYAGDRARKRASSPKLQAYNTGLVTATASRAPDAMRRDRVTWGRLVESAVGAHLVNAAAGGHFEVTYWRDRNREVDFVVGAEGVELATFLGRPGIDWLE